MSTDPKEEQNHSLKEQIGFTADNICRDVIHTLSGNICFAQVYDDVTLLDRNKLEFLDFVRSRANELCRTASELNEFFTIESQFKNVKSLRYFTHPNQKREDGRIGEDPFDLQKSFKAYRLLYPAAVVRPFQNMGNYYTFKNVRDSYLCYFGCGFHDILQTEELKNFKEQELDQAFDKAYISVEDEEEISRKETKVYIKNLDKMRDQVEEVFKTVRSKIIIKNNDDQTSLRLATLTFGYTVYALTHLATDVEISFEKRYFLIEQTQRALQHLANDS